LLFCLGPQEKTCKKNPRHNRRTLEKARRVAAVHWPESAYAVDRLVGEMGIFHGERQITIASRGAGAIELGVVSARSSSGHWPRKPTHKSPSSQVGRTLRGSAPESIEAAQGRRSYFCCRQPHSARDCGYCRRSESNGTMIRAECARQSMLDRDQRRRN
jgi:hypothetical protein